MSNLSGHESAAFDAEWNAISDCDGFTIDHYQLCWSHGATAPSVP